MFDHLTDFSNMTDIESCSRSAMSYVDELMSSLDYLKDSDESNFSSDKLLSSPRTSLLLLERPCSQLRAKLKSVHFCAPITEVREVCRLNRADVVGSACESDNYREQGSRRIRDQLSGWFDIRSIMAMSETCGTLKHPFEAILNSFREHHGTKFSSYSEEMPDIFFNFFTTRYYIPSPFYGDKTLENTDNLKKKLLSKSLLSSSIHYVGDICTDEKNITFQDEKNIFFEHDTRLDQAFQDSKNESLTNTEMYDDIDVDVMMMKKNPEQSLLTLAFLFD
eukprot:GHVL01010868.1.p1 GENE.GHVL01010868.1~~GHVL01010868.1.p1  ORF type:complete len:278 (-),score=40.51 GHVL01010868.1:41-874(-)